MNCISVPVTDKKKFWTTPPPKQYPTGIKEHMGEFSDSARLKRMNCVIDPIHQ